VAKAAPSTALLLLALVLARTATAQQAPPRQLTALTLEQLGEIEVSSVSKQAEDLWRTPVAISVLTQDDIRRSGSTSLPEILRMAPGVEVARIDSDHWSIGIRGFGDQFSKSLLVLIDGRNIYTPLFAGTYWPAYDTLIPDIERIEVIRGPGGTIWGGNTVSGVINIITRHSSQTRGTLVAVGTGSLDRATAALRHGGGNGRGFDYRVYAKAFNRGPGFHADGARFDKWWMTQGGFRTDVALGGRGVLTLTGDVSDGRHGQRVAITTLAPPGRGPVDGNLEAVGGNLVVNWERPTSADGSIRVQAYYDGTDWRAPHFQERRDTVDIDYTQSRTAMTRHHLLWGGGVRWSPGRYTPTVATLDFVPRNFTDRLASVFIQDQVAIVPERLLLTVGSKFERNNYTGLELQPSARLLWNVGTQTLWSAVSRAVRTPSRIERALTLFTPVVVPTVQIPVFIQLTGNGAVEAESVISYEAGFRRAAGARTSIDVTAFYTSHEDLVSFGRGPTVIETSPLRAVIVAPYLNGLFGTSHGFEVTPQVQLTSSWRIWASYSYRHFDLEATPLNAEMNAVSRYEGSSPRHQVRAQAQLSRHPLEVDLAYRAIGELPARTIGGYQTSDARIGWRLNEQFDLSLAAQNLLQRHHAEFAHDPGPPVEIPRSLFLGLTWTRSPQP
jgi:iron complex outermembrane recepter protein